MEYDGIPYARFVPHAGSFACHESDKDNPITDLGVELILVRKSDFDRLYRQATSAMLIPRHGEVVVTQSKYDALVRIAVECGLIVDIEGNVKEATTKRK